MGVELPDELPKERMGWKANDLPDGTTCMGMSEGASDVSCTMMVGFLCRPKETESGESVMPWFVFLTSLTVCFDREKGRMGEESSRTVLPRSVSESPSP